ncbi:OLC1v1006185C1 [Oldenlandia corymbosa var. corymbosa]|uniref:OLC1v1006185C1 n=1 Tax=Oldenlandia corymbosa var. corymbosa TaxID=529605 RepID=A0AAV1DHR8_OLDCO|nr:OLC1v1006185C1 [Oldenlandia corymbosa var. corymbosa]
MASLNFFVPPMVPTRRSVITSATAAKSAGGGKEEKGLLDFILGALQKEDQLLETDPILQKVEGKTATVSGGRKNSVAVPPPKKKEGGFGGFGGLFAKNE